MGNGCRRSRRPAAPEPVLHGRWVAIIGVVLAVDAVASLRGVLAQDESGSGDTDTSAFEADVSRFDEGRLIVWAVTAVSVIGAIMLVTYLCLRAGAPLNWLIAKADVQCTYRNGVARPCPRQPAGAVQPPHACCSAWPPLAYPWRQAAARVAGMLCAWLLEAWG